MTVTKPRESNKKYRSSANILDNEPNPISVEKTTRVLFSIYISFFALLVFTSSSQKNPKLFQNFVPWLFALRFFLFFHLFSLPKFFQELRVCWLIFGRNKWISEQINKGKVKGCSSDRKKKKKKKTFINGNDYDVIVRGCIGFILFFHM